MTKPDEKLSLIGEQLVTDKRAVSDGRVRVSTKTEFVTEAADARLDSESAPRLTTRSSTSSMTKALSISSIAPRAGARKAGTSRRP